MRIGNRDTGLTDTSVLPEGLKVTGAILSDQIKSLDWRVQRAKRFAKAPGEVVGEVLAKILALVGDDSLPAR